MNDIVVSPNEQFRGTLQKMTTEFHAALPQQISPEKFIRTTMTAVGMQPELLSADRKSLLGSCLKAAQDGLLPDGREAALVIFRTKDGPKVQYMPMYAGILKRARNSGDIASIAAHVVYENDQFEYELGDDERIVHKPMMRGDRGAPFMAYAIAKTKDGAVYREVMSVQEIEKVRSSSRASQSGPWVQWWDEMAKKTVFRRLAKRLPSSADLDRVFESDNETFDFSQAKNVTPEPATKGGSRLNRRLGIEEKRNATIESGTGGEANASDGGPCGTDRDVTCDTERLEDQGDRT